MDAASIAAAAVATPPPGPAVTVQVPRGQVDLIDFIDWTGVECLNQDSSHNIVNALKQAMTQILKGINSYRSSLKVPLSENKNAPVIRSVPFTITPIIMYSESGSRLFGFIGAGATLGQLFGSLFAASMAWLGPFLLLFSSLLMELAALSSKGMCIDENHASAELCQIGAGQAPNTMADDEISASNGDNDEWSEVQILKL